MFTQKEISFATLALSMALTLSPELPAAGKISHWILAQSPNAAPSFTLPQTVPAGTTVRVQSTDSMKAIANTLEQNFEQKYTGSSVDITEAETEAAIQSVQAGFSDLAAVGRPLSAEEKAQGLMQVPVTRHKIAIIVSPANSFANSLTIEQFAQIFRGEIKDWAAVGGTAGPIRVIDRPPTSDTRQAFNDYPVFQNAPLQTGDNATPVAEDDTALVITELGNDGIGYAIADQVVSNPQVKVLPMHDTLPSDPRYPFSQPLYYVYKGPAPSPAVQAFLGYATDKGNEQAIEDARRSGFTTVLPESPAPIPQETTALVPPPLETAPPETTGGGFPRWLGWLLLPLLGGLLWWWNKNRPSEPTEELIVRSAPPVAAPPVVPPISIAPESRLILTPRNCRDAYAYWEVPAEHKSQLRSQGGERLALRLYDVTDIDLDRQNAHQMEQFICNENDTDLHVPIPVDDRDYLAELGYLTQDDRWLSIARSTHVRVPPCPPVDGDGLNAAAIAGQSFIPSPPTDEVTNRLILTPRTPQEAHAYWEVSETDKAALRAQGGERLVLRIHDITDTNLDGQPDSTWDYDCQETDTDKTVPIHRGDRDYSAELGYYTPENRWLSLARSSPIYLPSAPSNVSATPTLTEVTPPPGGPSRIILAPRTPQEAYVYWEIAEADKAAVRYQGGERLVLRIYDLTDANWDGQPDSAWDYDCQETDTDKTVPIHQSDRDYAAEIGYYTSQGHWLSLARSSPMQIPADLSAIE